MMFQVFYRTFVLFIVSALALPLSACQRDQSDNYFKLTGRIFVFNYRVSQASYMVTIEQTRPISDGLSIVARFEDPTGGQPLEITRTAWPKLTRVSLASPPIRCVKSGVPYAVEIEIKDAKGALVQKIETSVTSNIDQSVLAAKPLIAGPVYEPNRDVYKQDGPDFSPDANCPNLK
jgi:hypothetical protein